MTDDNILLTGMDTTNKLTGSVPLHIWSVLLISSLGVFLASISTTALVIAFPVILIGKLTTFTRTYSFYMNYV